MKQRDLYLYIAQAAGMTILAVGLTSTPTLSFLPYLSREWKLKVRPIREVDLNLLERVLPGFGW